MRLVVELRQLVRRRHGGVDSIWCGSQIIQRLQVADGLQEIVWREDFGRASLGIVLHELVAVAIAKVHKSIETVADGTGEECSLGDSRYWKSLVWEQRCGERNVVFGQLPCVLVVPKAESAK